ncbi:MAG: carboxylating nicotinate-nucleotide diphosphorylase [Planctomycetes bacterium]|nr:carboxylating nicotinate-nucleotide diphosphorylase [Planctomycetota bacterium]
MAEILPSQHYEALVRAALAEDVGEGDRTTESLVPACDRGRGRFLCRRDGVWAGGPVIATVFQAIDPTIRVELRVPEGGTARVGEVAAEITGPLRALLTGERTALNFVQRLSGVATQTRRFVDAVRGTGVLILDTRKTLPGWRVMEKYAVRLGGGRNHRFGLHDQILIKDNHLEAVRAELSCALADAVKSAVRRAREASPALRVEVEIEDLSCFQAAVESGADMIMLDNRTPEEARAMVEWLDRRRPRGSPARPILEASGGVTLSNVRTMAEAGVDWISVGALTHSAPALDISMEVERLG